MEPQNGPPWDASRASPTGEGTDSSAPAASAKATSSSPKGTMVAAVNETVLGLSPAMSLIGQYLGSGLASQLGFFSAANQYQHQSMVAMSATTANVCRLLSGGRRASGSGRPRQPARGPDGGDAPQAGPPLEQSAESEPGGLKACNAAGQEAEHAVGAAMEKVKDTGF